MGCPWWLLYTCTLCKIVLRYCLSWLTHFGEAFVGPKKIEQLPQKPLFPRFDYC